MDPELNRKDRVGRLNGTEPEPEPQRVRDGQRKSSEYMGHLVGHMREVEDEDVHTVMGNRVHRARAGARINRAIARHLREPHTIEEGEIPTPLRPQRQTAFSTQNPAEVRRLQRLVRQGLVNKYGRPLR